MSPAGADGRRYSRRAGDVPESASPPDVPLEQAREKLGRIANDFADVLESDEATLLRDELVRLSRENAEQAAELGRVELAEVRKSEIAYANLMRAEAAEARVATLETALREMVKLFRGWLPEPRNTATSVEHDKAVVYARRKISDAAALVGEQADEPGLGEAATDGDAAVPLVASTGAESPRTTPAASPSPVPVVACSSESNETPRPRRCPTCDSPSPERHPSVQSEGETEPCADHWHDADDRQSDWLKGYIAEKRAQAAVVLPADERDDERCECGHTAYWHTEHDDVPCEASNFVAPGSFVACECEGFAAALPADEPERETDRRERVRNEQFGAMKAALIAAQTVIDARVHPRTAGLIQGALDYNQLYGGEL